MASSLDLRGRTALVTGAGQGVGAGIASMLAEAGCASRGSNDLVAGRAHAQADALRGRGGDAVAVPFDVTDFARVTEMVGGLGRDCCARRALAVGCARR